MADREAFEGRALEFISSLKRIPKFHVQERDLEHVIL